MTETYLLDLISKQTGSIRTLIGKLEAIQKYIGETQKDTTLFFRGQSDIKWQISPSVFRNEKYIDQENHLVHELIRFCPNEFLHTTSYFEKLVKMQHYELPTRLLDISTNPLVGLYFATCQNKSTDGNLIVFPVKNSDILSFDNPLVENISKLSFESPDSSNRDSNESGRAICVLPKLDNPRIIRQQGAFFLFESSKIKNLKKYEIIIDHKNKNKIQQQLNSFGINSRFLFPEIDKAAL